MSSKRLARGTRATSITTFAALLIVAALTVAPTPAHAATTRPAQDLAQGAGMGAKPSVQVRAVQRALKRRGYDLGRPGVDGRFGPLTDAAVRRMQADYRLPVDGIVGPRTRSALHLSRVNAEHANRGSHTGDMSPTAADRKATKGAHPTHSGNVAQRGSNSSGHGSVPSLQGSAAPSRAAVTTRGNASMRLADPGDSWLTSILAGGLAGLVGALSAIGISAAWRRRHRPEPAGGMAPPAPEPKVNDSGPERRPRAMTNDRPNGARPRSSFAPTAAASRSRIAPGDPVIGYVTVAPKFGSARDSASSAAIEAACERAGWNLIEIVRDRDKGRPLERPGLRYALQRIADGKACGLIVCDLQRLGRSIVNLGALMAWFRDAHATLVALDDGLDTSTPEGHYVATTLITMSAREHERIAARTREGLADVRANGRTAGRPAVSDSPELLERIAAMRMANMTLQAIADQLNAEGVPTLRGGAKWRPSSIQAALGYRRPHGRDHLPVPEVRTRR